MELTQKHKQIISVVLLGAAVAYDFLPTDFVPDIPVVGWMDDFLLTSTAALNCLQQFTTEENQLMQKVLKWLKWTCLLLAILIILVFALLISTIISIFS